MNCMCTKKNTHCLDGVIYVCIYTVYIYILYIYILYIDVGSLHFNSDS